MICQSSKVTTERQNTTVSPRIKQWFCNESFEVLFADGSECIGLYFKLIMIVY